MSCGVMSTGGNGLTEPLSMFRDLGEGYIPYNVTDVGLGGGVTNSSSDLFKDTRIIGGIEVREECITLLLHKCKIVSGLTFSD